MHKLTREQREVQAQILRLADTILAEKKGTGHLVFVEGDAGSGKTILMSSTFHELCCRDDGETASPLRCVLLVNHDEQLHVYRQIADRLGLKADRQVMKPTSFINTNKVSDPVDIAFVDEAHLLLTQGKQAYRGKNQLEDILARARLTVAVFDPMQVLQSPQIWEDECLQRFRDRATVYALKGQLRMHAPESVIRWISLLAKEQELTAIPQEDSYPIRLFDSPQDLEAAIREKAGEPESRLSRLIATYDWPYSQKKREDGGLWEVRIATPSGEWHKPWNYQYEGKLTCAEKEKAWAEQAHTLDEIGSTFTVQGFDLNYAGLIIGPSVSFEDGRIVFRPEASHNHKATQKRTLRNNEKISFAEELLKHELYVLMTRGVDGLFIYAVDEKLRAALCAAARKAPAGKGFPVGAAGEDLS